MRLRASHRNSDRMQRLFKPLPLNMTPVASSHRLQGRLRPNSGSETPTSEESLVFLRPLPDEASTTMGMPLISSPPIRNSNNG